MVINANRCGIFVDWKMNKLVFLLVSLLICSSVYAESTALKPIDPYYSHASSGEWQKALPIIKGMVESDPSIPSRWFQYGSCLEELKMHAEAISAFKKAYELDATDFGSQYRIFRNYALAKDTEGFVAFAKAEAVKTPQILELISQREEFKAIVSSEAYSAFLQQL